MATAVTILKWVAGIVAAVIVGVGGLAINRSIDKLDKLDARLSAMELWKAEVSGTRFTSHDGQQVWQKIADLQREMATLPKEVPPKWFVDRVALLESKVDKNAQELADIKAMLKGKGG